MIVQQLNRACGENCCKTGGTGLAAIICQSTKTIQLDPKDVLQRLFEIDAGARQVGECYIMQVYVQVSFRHL